MSQIVALTGATGFIGGALVRRLAAAGHPVRVLVRSGSATLGLAGLSVETITGDLQDTQSLRRLVNNARAVIHCAGAVRGAEPHDFNCVNIDGTARLASIAAEQRVAPRFLLLSSLAAREPSLSFYAASKHGGEKALSENAGNMDWTILRPPAVYGPGDRELLPLFRWMSRGIAPILGPASARFSLIYIDDLACAALTWLQSAPPSAKTFTLADGRDGGYAWADVVKIMGELRGRRIRTLRVPAMGLRLAASISKIGARISGGPPMLTAGKVRELRHPDWVCGHTELSAAIGWQPEVQLEQGLRETLNWRPRAASEVNQRASDSAKPPQTKEPVHQGRI